MKFIVDELPYYSDGCPLITVCHDSHRSICPRNWDKYKVCSDDNPHECLWLKEVGESND